MALREYDFENIPTVSIVKKILTDAIKMEATDIHFDPTPDELIIKFRINGDLKEYTTAPDNVKTNIITRVKILASMNITDSLLPQTGAISFELNSKTHNMLVSSLPVIDGEKIVVHISNYAKNIKNLRSIGFNENDYHKIKNLLKEPQGIILITGNTNSGKTTTTYSLLKELNSEINNIISIEDPVKMRIKGINQVEIAPEKGLTYKNVLKNTMLQDPNIIAINDLVDDDTTRFALRASISGRLVISTMHTKTAYQTIDTLLNMDIENYLLGSNLSGIISQRLVKRLCPTCRKLRHATPYEASVMKHVLGVETTELYSPNGCEECNDGYIDQIPIAEVIEVDEELRNAISNNRKRNLIRNIIYEGNDSIIKDGFKKVLEGKTSFEEVIRVMDLRVDFIDDNKIRKIILGNGEPTEDTTTMNSNSIEETTSPNETPSIEESSIGVEPEKKEQPKEEEPQKESIVIKVEPDKEETNNITNLQVSPTELNNILSKIEESATKKPDEKAENPTEEITKVKEPETIPTKAEETPQTTNNTPIPVEPEVVPTKVEETKAEQITTTKDEPTPVIIDPEPKEETPVIERAIQPITEPVPIQVETESKAPEEIAKVVEEIPTNIENTPVTSEQKENMQPTPVEQTSPIEQQNIAVAEPVQEAQITPEQTVTTPVIVPTVNFEDDDDDDNFNYGEGYINNF